MDILFDTCDEETVDDNAEGSDTSNRSKTDSDSERNPDGWDTPLNVWGEVNDNMESRGSSMRYDTVDSGMMTRPISISWIQ